MGFITSEDQREREREIQEAKEEHNLGSGFPSTVEELEEAESLSNYEGTAKAAITGLWKVEIRMPPFDEPDAVSEFLGKDIAPDVVRGRFRETFQKIINSDTRAKILYYWRFGRAATGTGAKVRARTFTRMFHPFEPDKIHVKGVGKKEGDTVVITAINL